MEECHADTGGQVARDRNVLWKRSRMKRLIAIALLIGAVLFGASGMLAYYNSSAGTHSDPREQGQTPWPWLFLLGSAACFGGGILLLTMGHVDGGQPLVKGTPKPDPTKVAGGGLPKALN